MAKTTLKTVERKTTVSREKIREAFAAAMGNDSKVNGKPYESNKKETIEKKASFKKALSK